MERIGCAPEGLWTPGVGIKFFVPTEYITLAITLIRSQIQMRARGHTRTLACALTYSYADVNVLGK